MENRDIPRDIPGHPEDIPERGHPGHPPHEDIPDTHEDIPDTHLKLAT